MKKSGMANKALREAFDAMVIITAWGEACYRTYQDVPMGMPSDVERKVKAALKALRRERAKGK